MIASPSPATSTSGTRSRTEALACSALKARNEYTRASTSVSPGVGGLGWLLAGSASG